MAERHTVDVDVVGSKPIRLPKKYRLRFRRRYFLGRSHILAEAKNIWPRQFLLTLDIPNGTW